MKQALSAGSAAQQAQVAQALKGKEAQYLADGIDPAAVPKVLELRQKLMDFCTESTGWYPTLGLTSNRDALNQPVVATNYGPEQPHLAVP